MDIKIATLEQIPFILGLIDEFDREKSPMPNINEINNIYHSINNNGGCIIAAMLSDKIIGTCTLNVCANLSWSGRPYGIIENVIVTQALRNKGIGKALLDFAKEYAFEKNCYKVALMTGSKKEATLKFYESAGFKSNKTGYEIRNNA